MKYFFTTAALKAMGLYEDRAMTSTTLSKTPPGNLVIHNQKALFKRTHIDTTPKKKKIILCDWKMVLLADEIILHAYWLYLESLIRVGFDIYLWQNDTAIKVEKKLDFELAILGFIPTPVDKIVNAVATKLSFTRREITIWDHSEFNRVISILKNQFPDISNDLSMGSLMNSRMYYSCNEIDIKALGQLSDKILRHVLVELISDKMLVASRLVRFCST